MIVCTRSIWKRVPLLEDFLAGILWKWLIYNKKHKRHTLIKSNNIKYGMIHGIQSEPWDTILHFGTIKNTLGWDAKWCASGGLNNPNLLMSTSARICFYNVFKSSRTRCCTNNFSDRQLFCRLNPVPLFLSLLGLRLPYMSKQFVKPYFCLIGNSFL